MQGELWLLPISFAPEETFFGCKTLTVFSGT